MKLANIHPGDTVYVVRGYSRRLAVVQEVHDGKVSVNFTDTVGVDTRTWADRSSYFGATVRPAQVEARA